jgi:hypothetical protein
VNLKSSEHRVSNAVRQVRMAEATKGSIHGSDSLRPQCGRSTG